MDTVRTFSRFLLALSVRVIIAILVGALLLTAVYCIPTDRMDANLGDSVEVFQKEGTMPELFGWCTSYLDNFTDAIMLSNAAHDVPASAMVQAMTAARFKIGEQDPVESLIGHYVQGQPFDSDEPYYQYWHGYLITLKPLLFFMSYQGIRLVNTAMQLGLLVWLIWLMVRKGLAGYIAPYLICLAFLMPVTLALSLQFSSCYYLLLLGSIALLLAKESLQEKAAFIFLYLGICTAYFDFLTYPIATLGIPAVFYFCLQDLRKPAETFCKGVKICFSWGFGYGVMWAGKWVVGSIITGKNVLAEAASKITERSSANIAVDESFLSNAYAALSANIKFFLKTPATPVYALCIIVLLVILVLGWKKKQFTLSDAGRILFPFFILACLPPVWYMVTTNHSIIHYWFTGKALCVSVFASLCALIKLKKDCFAA